MSRIKLKSISTSDGKFTKEATVVINAYGNFDRSTGLEQDLTLTRDEHGRWSATIALDDFPLKDTPEEAVERLSLWLKTLSKALNHKQVKRLNLGKILKSINF